MNKTDNSEYRTNDIILWLSQYKGLLIEDRFKKEILRILWSDTNDYWQTPNFQDYQNHIQLIARKII
jgi:hypothetical protein